MGGPRSRRRTGLSILAVALFASTFISAPAPALGQEAPTTDRWSGRWDVEGDSNDDGVYEHFGVLTLELVTDGTVTHPACENDTDRHYRGTYPYGGGGTFEGCESSELDYELYFDYYNNNGSWGQGVMTFRGGTPATWDGYYSPPTTGSTGVPADLRWRGSKLESCPAPQSSGLSYSRSVQQAGEQSCDAEVVKFTFTQGGLPSRHSRALEDVRTVGNGKVTFIPNPDGDDHTVVAHSGRVVRQLEYVHDEDELRFKVSPTGGLFVFLRDRALVMSLGLEAVESNDSRCPRKTKSGDPRRARIALRDGSASGEPDIVQLVVEGCSHHNYEFKGRNRVKVAIVHMKPS